MGTGYFYATLVAGRGNRLHAYRWDCQWDGGVIAATTGVLARPDLAEDLQSPDPVKPDKVVVVR